MLTKFVNGLLSGVTRRNPGNQEEKICDAPIEHDPSFNVSIYKIIGSRVDLLLPKAKLLFTDGKIQIEIDDQLELEWLFARISSVRQYRTTSAQFIYQSSPDKLNEYGVHFEDSDKAIAFRESLMAKIVLLCTPMIDTAVETIEIFNIDSKVFDKWPDCPRGIAVVQRDHDGMTSCVLYRGRDSTSDMFCVIELTSEVHLWCTPDLRQFTMWVPSTSTGKSKPTDTSVGQEVARQLMRITLDAGPSLIADFFLILERTLGTALEGNDTDANSEFVSLDRDCDEKENVLERKSIDASYSSDSDYELSWNSEYQSSSADVSLEDLDEEFEDEARELPTFAAKTKPSRISISCDPSHEIIEKDAKAKLHRFMQVGNEKSFVCRSTDLGDDGIHWKTASKKADSGTDFDLLVYSRKDRTHRHVKEDTAIQGNKFKYGNKSIVPTKGLLHSNEKKLILTDRDDPRSLYYMDMEKETVVQKFETEAGSPHVLWSSKKESSMSSDPTFMCAATDYFALMDTRSASKNAAKHVLHYSSNPQFSAGVNDGKGHVLLGSSTGQLRLYDGQPNAQGKMKIAKTLLECRREPIKAVDCTDDGSWILATMRTCLAMFPVKLRSTSRTGFESRLGQKKPPAVYLRLTQDDIAKYQLDNIDFQPAQFDQINQRISTSTGNLSIQWDFRSIKKGVLDDYRLKILPHYIKDSKALSDGSVVVAYPTDLGVVSSKRASMKPGHAN